MAGLLWALLALAALPVVVLWLQVLLAWPRRSAGLPAAQVRKEGAAPRCAVLVPAHNEAQGIGATVRQLRLQLAKGDTLLVVADNCTDATAKLAREAGAAVVERQDAARRGKGYALDHGVRHLAAQTGPAPEVLIIVDADCVFSPADGVHRLARQVLALGRPVQCLDLMDAPTDADLKTRVAAFAWRLKNWVRPLGWRSVGAPCQLMGTGMAFPWAMAQQMQLASGELVEDMQLGINLALAGTPPQFCPAVLVTSVFPTGAQAVQSQRTRWEHGHLGMIAAQAPRLFAQALRRRDARLLALALDLAVPPLALLALLQCAVLALCALAALLGLGWGPLWAALACLGLFTMAVGMAWWGWGRAVVSARDLLFVPLYVLGKLPLYVGYLFKRQKEWVRTDRE